MPYAAVVALLAALYFASAKLGFFAAAAHGVVSSAWPPSGIALAALVLLGVRFWPAVALGAFLANATSGVPVAGAAAIAAGNTLEAVAGTWLLAHVAGFRPALDRVRDVLALAGLAAIVSTTVSATIGVASLAASGAGASDRFATLWLSWWSGDAIGDLLVAPLMLTWATAARRMPTVREAAEALLLAAVTVALTIGLFEARFAYVYAIFPAVLWTALRFGPRGAATASALVSVLAVSYTVRGVGPFTRSSAVNNLFQLQTFMGLLALTALVVAAVMWERTAAEAALRQEQGEAAEVLQFAPVGIYRASWDGMILFANPTLAHILGRESPHELIGRNLATDVYARPEDRPALLARFETTDEARGLEVRWKKKDGTPIWVEMYARVIRDTSGRKVGFQGFIYETTERKQLEDQLRQAQKIEAIGRLAGGVAHDFNNLLTAILGGAELLRDDLPKDDPRGAELDDIMEAAQRGAALTHQLLAFSRKQILEPRVFSLNDLVRNAAKMLGRLIGEDIELISATAPDLGAVEADPGQIEQVLMNLVVNARDAMPRGGRLTIETANVELDEEYARRRLGATPGPHVMLAVTDTGVGMDEATKARLFEPFFTTKEAGKGTGLGLATVYGIVKQSGGSIWVYSEVGKGTSFKVYLPRVFAEPREHLAPRAAAPRPKGTETILLVEDDLTLRALARRVLSASGYTVVEANSPADAITLCERDGAQIDLLLTDVVMPGMGGVELAERIRRIRANLKVLYMSGYTHGAVSHQQVLPPGVAYLQKPFTPGKLASRVREVLDGPETASGRGGDVGVEL